MYYFMKILRDQINFYSRNHCCMLVLQGYCPLVLNKEGTREGDLRVSTGGLGWGFAKIPAVNLRSVARS